MTDVFNLSKQIEDLKTEIKSLKAESRYIKKKAEITPLIALFNHIRAKNYEGKSIVYTITFYTKKKERHSYGFDKIIALNDSIHEHTDDGLKRICDIDEIVNVELVSMYKGIHRLFEYKFDN